MTGKNKKKIILVLLIVLFVLAPFSSGGVNKTEAFLGFGDLVIEIGPISIKELVLDAIAWQLANLAIEEITRQTVNWINGNSDGDPKFVTDVGRFLGDVADKTLGEFFLNEFPLVCSPFQLEVRARLVESFRPERRFQCTLTEVFQNVEDFTAFVDGDFFKGGWEGWLNISRPQNNSRGATLAAQNSIQARIVGRQGLELARLDWGRGFISWEQCPAGATEYCPAEIEGGNFRPPDQCAKAERLCITTVNINGANIPVPTNKETRTPGSVIETQLNNVVNAGQDRLIVADEIDEVIGALLNRLISEVIGSPGGLLGTNTDDIDSSPVFARVSAIPTSVPIGTAPTLTWIARGADSCVASDGWSGNKNPIGGSETPSVLNTPTTYTLRCSGSEGSFTSSVTVTIGDNIPPGGSCVFFASNGGDYCDEDENDSNGILTGGGTVTFRLNTGTGATWFITPFQDMVSNPPLGGWVGNPNCQEYGNFRNCKYREIIRFVRMAFSTVSLPLVIIVRYKENNR